MRLALFAVVLASCRATPRPRADAAAPDVPVVALPATVARGVAYAHDWTARGARGYGTESDHAQLRRLRALGATWVSVTPFAYADGPRATTVRASYDRPGSETDAALRATVREAHALGMRVLLKPHLWVRGSWPGALAPAGEAEAAALTEAWGAVTLHYATLAQEEGVEALTVGVEMDPLARAAPAAWRAVIAAARERFHGTLTYAANWPEVDAVPFWDALDVVAVNHYAPLASRAGDVPVDGVFARARAAMARYAEVSRRVRRPVWLTEVGFRRDARALLEPWAWVRRGERAREPAEDPQRVGLAAVLRAVAATPEVTGVFVWKWFSSGGDEGEGTHGFVFAGRPGEAVVRAAFAAP